MRLVLSWRRLAALSWRDRLELAEAWLELLRADFRVRFAPYSWWRPELRSDPADDPGHLEEARRIASLLGAAARHHVIEMNCLRRTLALRALLRRRGIPARVSFGARRQRGTLDAHVWLEIAGSSLEPSGRQRRYARMEDAST